MTNYQNKRRLESAREQLLAWLDYRKIASWKTKVRVASNHSGVAEADVIEVFKIWDAAGIGRYIQQRTIGGKVHERRFEWSISSKQFAEMAV